MVDTVLPADAVEQYVHRRLRIFPGEHLAIVGEDLLGHAMRSHGGHEPMADELGSLPRHQPRRHADPGVVVDAGQRLGRGAVGEQEAAHQVQLPQLHRPAALPTLPDLLAAVALDRVDDAGAYQAPGQPRPRWRPRGTLSVPTPSHAPRPPVTGRP